MVGRRDKAINTKFHNHPPLVGRFSCYSCTVALFQWSWSICSEAVYCMRTLRKTQGGWGLFSMRMPGRTGQECRKQYQKVMDTYQDLVNSLQSDGWYQQDFSNWTETTWLINTQTIFVVLRNCCFHFRPCNDKCKNAIMRKRHAESPPESFKASTSLRKRR